MKSISISRFPPLSYACGEAINTLCTNLSFLGKNIKKIMLTSCHASEGKSYLSMNIMRTMAKLGHNVVLVDADLRRSMISSKYSLQFQGAKTTKGLAHYLAGMSEIDDVIYETNIPNAYMVPVGRTVSNPLPLLNSQLFEKLLDELAGSFDYVLVDASPMGIVIDGAQIARSCDGTLLVVGYNAVRRQELIDVKEQLEQTGCPILGAVLNMVEYDSYLNRKYYYKSYYSSYGYYGKEDNEGQGRNSKKKSGVGNKETKSTNNARRPVKGLSDIKPQSTNGKNGSKKGK